MTPDNMMDKRNAPEPTGGEILDHLVWRDLGFEKQFGMTFFQPPVDVQNTDTTDLEESPGR
jgi:hypothetical protein